MSDQPVDGSEVLELLGDSYVRAIVAETSTGPLSAKELGERLDVDVSTVYRRIDDMLDHGLVVERTRIVRDGSHHSVYEANVDTVEVDVDDGDISVHVTVRESAADRFTRMWTTIRET